MDCTLSCKQTFMASPYIHLLNGHHNSRQCLPGLSRCHNGRDDNSCRDWRAAASGLFSPFRRTGKEPRRRVIICLRSCSSRSKVIWKQNLIEYPCAWYCSASSRMSRQTPALSCNPFLPNKPKTSSLPYAVASHCPEHLFSGPLASSLSVFTKALLHF